MIHLIVAEPFGGYAKGDRITDSAEVDEVRAGPNRAHVIATASHDVTPDEPEAAPSAPEAPSKPAKAPAEPKAPDTPE